MDFQPSETILTSPLLSKTTLPPEVLIDKIYGALIGHAMGDAIGLSTEFLNSKQASFHYGAGPISYDNFLKDPHRKRWRERDFTDDTDQMILIMENLIQNHGEVNTTDLAASLVRWSMEGFRELGDAGGMGIGATVRDVLKHPNYLSQPLQTARSMWLTKGRNLAANGAVMRSSLLGIAHFYDLPKLEQQTIQVCGVTHADLRCKASCVALTVAIGLILQGKEDVEEIIDIAFKEADKCISVENYKNLLTEEHKIELNEIQQIVQAQKQELKKHLYSDILDLQLDEGTSIGYTFKCVGSGFWALRRQNFKEAITHISLQAGDADTNGAVAGAILGCKLGFSRLPPEWMPFLHHHWFQHKIIRFMDTIFKK
uniref:ADP-ribosylglycohydrolase n=1 Tax=Arcella intermedia TaxID=1963864 RepID=A0A6B2L7N5_9EUKA